MTSSVFLSYASQDLATVAQIAAALRAAGIEVWFDQNELRGGDLWQQNIQQHIRECRLFVPIISSATQARGEGFFRLEWKLAVDRSHLMASDQRFIVPVVIDATSPASVRVPDRFRDYQWIHLPADSNTTQIVERVASLLAEDQETPESQAAPLTHGPVSPPRTPPRKRARRGVLAAALVVAMLILAFAVVYERRPAKVIPYSAEDRRMTFAALPAISLPHDEHAATVATANTEAYARALERNTEWALTVDRSEAQQAAQKFRSMPEIAKALNVHFLVRGVVEKRANGYDVELQMIDGENARVIATENLKLDDADLVAPGVGIYDDTVAPLLFQALKVEVQRAESRPDQELDVRDLTFRGYAYLNSHGNDAESYRISEQYLERALKLAPDDRLALISTAEMNLCDCIDAWATDVSKETAIGAAALDKINRLYPKMPTNVLRLRVLMLRKQYADALSLSESAIRQVGDYPQFEEYRVLALIHLGRAQDALSAVKMLEARKSDNPQEILGLIAAVEFASGNYIDAANYARAAKAVLTDAQAQNPNVGTVRLTLAAAEANLGNKEQARTVIQELQAIVPQATTTAKVQGWMYPLAPLYGYQPLFDGLRLAGLPD